MVAPMQGVRLHITALEVAQLSAVTHTADTTLRGLHVKLQFAGALHVDVTASQALCLYAA